MKVAVSQKTLISMITRGGSAAMSKASQSDSTPYAPLVKAVKITASDKELVVESINRSFSVKCSMPVSKDNGIEVKESGVTVVSAQDLYDWVSKQGNSVIGMNLVNMDVPEMVAGKGGKDDDFHKNDIVRKIANLKLSSKDGTRTGAKWTMDSYDSSQYPKAKSGAEILDLFTISKKNIENSLNSIKFSAQTSDPDHVYDSVCIQNVDNAIYMATTDALRCSLYDVSKFLSNKGVYWDKPYNEKIGARILVSISSLETIIDAMSDKPVNVFYCKDKNYVTFEQEGYFAYLSVKDSSVFGKFPNIAVLTTAQSREIGLVPKQTLMSRLITSSLVNKESAFFQFKNGEFKIHVISDGGKSPNTSTCPIENMQIDAKHVWGVQHLLGVLKAVKDDNVLLMSSKNGGGFKIKSKEDPNVTYFGTTIQNCKYNNLDLV